MQSMAQGTGIITEIRIEPGEKNSRSGRIRLPAEMRPAPGQYLMAASPDPADPLPTPLFSMGLEGEDLAIAPPLPHHWSAGMALAMRGPLGNGFRLPPSARRVALAALDASPGRLLPLALAALAQRAAVALYTRLPPAELSNEVEVLPLDLLGEAPSWADYLALDFALADLATVRAALGLRVYGRTPCIAEALISAPMPCGGMAACGACAVLTRAGWRLACEDGPVFDFNVLEAA